MSLKPFTTKKLGHLLLHYLPYGFLAIWLLYFGSAFENTLTLAAGGRIDFSAAWAYRFRGTDFESGRTTWNLVFPIWLWVVKFTGPRIFWAASVILISALLPRKSILWKIFFLVTVTCGVLYSEAVLIWILTILLLRNTFLFFQQRRIRAGIIAASGTLVLVAIALRWANPGAYFQRQNVLGGKSVMDSIELRTVATKINIHENCVAAINPDDLRGINSVENISRESLSHFSRIALVDLKIVEDNYRLLLLKDEKGKPLFSDAARTFAAAEAAYAQKVLPDLVAAKNLCLVANFDISPQIETAPYSRARKISELRKKAGLDTKLIQLPVAPTKR